MNIKYKCWPIRNFYKNNKNLFLINDGIII